MDSMDQTTSKGWSNFISSASIRMNFAFTPSMDTASAKTTPDIENPIAGHQTGQIRETLNELNLGPLFGFFPANPITMMQVHAPEISAIGAYPVVESSDSVFVVIVTHRCNVLPSLQIGSEIAPADRMSYPAAELEI